MSDYDVSDRSEDERHVFSDEERGRRSGSGSDRDDGQKKPEEKKQTRKKKTGPIRHTILNENDLTGKNGVPKLTEIFRDFKFHGKGHEKRDLDNMLLKYEQWVHLMHPKYPFMQVVERIEFLGMKKRPVKTMLRKIRMGIQENQVDGEDLVERGPASSEDEVERNENVDTEYPDAGDVLEPTDDWQADDFPDDDDELFAAIDADLEQAGLGKDITTDGQNATVTTKDVSQAKNVVTEDSDDDDDFNPFQAKKPQNTSSREPKKGVIDSLDEDIDDAKLLEHSDAEDSVAVPRKSSQNSTAKSRSSRKASQKSQSRVSDSEDEIVEPSNENTKVVNDSSDDSDYALLSHEGDQVPGGSKKASSPEIRPSKNSGRKSNQRTQKKKSTASKVLKDKNDESSSAIRRSQEGSSLNKRRRIKAFDDDEDDDDVLHIDSANKSGSDLSDNEAADVSQKSGKRRRVESSDEDEPTAADNSKEIQHKRRIIVSDSDED